jgi:hypothetical protein
MDMRTDNVLFLPRVNDFRDRAAYNIGTWPSQSSVALSAFSISITAFSVIVTIGTRVTGLFSRIASSF